MLFVCMYQVNEGSVAGDGFMMNLLSVLQKLAIKVNLDKVSCSIGGILISHN